MRYREYLIALASVAAATAGAFGLQGIFSLTNLAMVYLLATLVVALRGHRRSAALAATLGVLSFDFFFVPPRFTFTVHDSQYVWTFIVMFVTAMAISHLTVRVRAEADAARQGRERVEAERVRNVLLSSVSHDLRTPLAAILGSASSLGQLVDFPVAPVARELLDTIQTESRRLSQLVGNVLEATRLESGAIQLRKELYPLEDVLGSVLERLEKSLGNHGLDLDIPQDLPAIPMDAMLIGQVLTNLLENALRYAPGHSRIKITAVKDGETVVVSVADSGKGIEPGSAERVFDKFYHDPESPGAGLGLAICRGIVHAHGGKIWAENRAEGGAVFTFKLPVRLTPATHVAAPSPDGRGDLHQRRGPLLSGEGGPAEGGG